MASLPNMPPDNTDFNLLLNSFESEGLFDQHVVTCGFELAVDYAKPGPHPKHNLKTNFVIGHGLVDYREDEDPLWPKHNRLMVSAFIPPVLPPGELPVTLGSLPDEIRGNPNVTSTGPALLIKLQGLINISNVAIYRGYVPAHPPTIPFRRIPPMIFMLNIHPNPLLGVEPYTLLYTEACALNELYTAVQNDTPTFPEFQHPDRIIRQFSSEIDNLFRAVNSADDARPFLGERGNRGWYHIFNLHLSPFMKRIRNINHYRGGVLLSTSDKGVLTDLIQGMTVAVLGADPRFQAAEERQHEQDLEEETEEE